MDAQTFLDNFGTIADAPGGVDRLRELVLDLAVRGQLTQQDPQDGRVDEQLSAIAGVVQPSTLVDPITDRAIPWDIPATWRWVRFKQIVDFAPGKTPSTKDSSYWEEPELGELWASISDMPDSGTLFTTSRAISQKAVTSVMRRPPAPVGALLMSFKLTIGKVCRVGRPTYFNEAIIEIDTPREVAKEFLFRTLPLLALGGSSKAAIKGNTLNKGSITNIPIPFPPLEEQERIVAKIDQLTQLCDDLEARQQARHHITRRLRASSLDALTNAETDDDLHTAWSRIHTNWEILTDHPDSIEALRGTILGMAIRGRLSAQDPADEPASSLLSRIHAERQEFAAGGRIKKSTKNPGALDAPFALPETWAWVRLGSVALEMRYGTSAKSKPDGAVPVLRMGNLQSGEIDWANLKYTSDEAEIAKYHLPSPAVLFNRTNSKELVGKTAIYRGERPAIFAGYLIHVRCSLGLDPEYLNLVLNTPMAKSWCWAIKTDGISQSNISASKLAEFPFPLAPLAEQRRIAKRVSQLLDQCAGLSRALAIRHESAALLSATAVAMA